MNFFHSKRKRNSPETVLDAGITCIILGTKSLAMTWLDSFNDDKLVDNAVEEFRQILPERLAEIFTRNLMLESKAMPKE